MAQDNRQQKAQSGVMDTAVSDVRGAIRTGKNVAKAANNVKKTVSTVRAAKAAAAVGGPAGAIAALLADDRVRKAAIAVAIVCSMFFTMCLFALPAAIWEAIETFWRNFREEYLLSAEENEIIFYSGGQGPLIRSVTVVGGNLEKAVTAYWDNVTSSFSGTAPDDASGSSAETYGDSSLQVMASEDAAIEETQRKIDATKEKIKARADQLLADAVGISGTSASPTGMVTGALTWSYGTVDCLKLFNETYGESGTPYFQVGGTAPVYKVGKDFYIYTGVRVSGSVPTISDREAVRLLALYMAQTGGSLNEISMGSYLRWLGYYDGLGYGTYLSVTRGMRSVPMQVGEHTTTVNITSHWSGTYLPQYLYEEMHSRIEAETKGLAPKEAKKAEQKIRAEYAQYMAPAVDLILDLGVLTPANGAGYAEEINFENTYNHLKNAASHMNYGLSAYKGNAAALLRYVFFGRKVGTPDPESDGDGLIDKWNTYLQSFVSSSSDEDEEEDSSSSSSSSLSGALQSVLSAISAATSLDDRIEELWMDFMDAHLTELMRKYDRMFENRGYHVHLVTYDVSTYVRVRRVDELVQMTGLWSGALDDENGGTGDILVSGTELPTNNGGPLDLAPGHYRMSYTGKNNTIDYWLHIPEDATTNMPVILSMHGDSHGMDDLSWEASRSSGVGITGRTQSIFGEKFPFILVVPASPGRAAKWDQRAYNEDTFALLQYVVKTYQCNPSKVIVTGHSRGAMGAWTMASNHPGYFSACVPVSCNTSDYAPRSFGGTAICAFAGSGGVEDTYYAEMSKMIDAIEAYNTSAKLVRVNAGHAGTQTVVYSINLFLWMVSQ